MTETPLLTQMPNQREPDLIATRLVVVSGLSGSGKTIALRTLEDLDYYCVDNLPIDLMLSFVHSVTQNQQGRYPRLAVGIDVRNRVEDLSHLPEILAQMAQQKIDYQLVFLDTRDEVLFKRFSETRRRHPLSSDSLSLTDAIALERRLLHSLIGIADKVIDSSDLNVHQLRRVITTAFGVSHVGTSLLFESFAYKRGLPGDADFVFDARCLPNPHWDPRLKPLSGKDAAVRSFFEQHAMVEHYFADIRQMLERWIPRFEAEQRGYVTTCIGCTGGRHRSVYLVERLAESFRASRETVISFHRELE
jgi:UPF0042 nucleotide-binding protein